MIILLAAFSLILPGCDKQEEDNQLTSFPPMSDPNDVCSSMDDIVFMQYCYDNFDVNKDGKVSTTEANAVHEISVSNKKIQSLRGIQYFGKLTSLVCNNNQLRSLDVSKNTALTSLTCKYTQLTSLDVSKNTALTSLVCSHSQLTSLDVSKNTVLGLLACNYNQLTAQALNSLFESLPPHKGSSGKIYFLDNPGAATCDQSIFSKKGWRAYDY